MQSLDEVASLEDLEEEARLEWQSACTQRALSMHSGRISKKRLAWNGNHHALKGHSACTQVGSRRRGSPGMAISMHSKGTQHALR